MHRNIFTTETADEIKEILKKTPKDDPNYKLIYQDWCMADEEECALELGHPNLDELELDLPMIPNEDDIEYGVPLIDPPPSLESKLAEVKKAKTMIRMAKKLLK